HSVNPEANLLNVLLILQGCQTPHGVQGACAPMAGKQMNILQPRETFTQLLYFCLGILEEEDNNGKTRISVKRRRCHRHEWFWLNAVGSVFSALRDRK